MSTEVFEQFWQYSQWANAAVLARLEQLGQDLPASTLRLMSHIVNAQSVWLNRLTGQPLTVLVWDEHDLPTCKRLNAETMEGIKGVILRQKEDMNVVISYTNTAGTAFETAMPDILLQIFNHGTYHRAQIAMDLRQ